MRSKALFAPVVFSLFLLSLSSCSRQPGHITPSFYYWSTSYAITGADSALLDQTACKKMYVRFFDVGPGGYWQEGNSIIPKGRLEHKHGFIAQVQTVPVVYIENDCFASVNTTEDLTWLSSKITTKLFRMARNHGLPEESIEEVQIDCDWTDKTRDSYFEFLRIFKKQCGDKKLSVTLRLYQYKYRTRSGIPPVDRCMLMYYNMSDLKDPLTKNYILDNATGKRYISGVGVYPLPLDFALPIYSQGVEFHSSDSTFYGLRNMTIGDTAGKKVVSADTEKGSIILRDKDYTWSYTRYEFITPENLVNATTVLSEAVNTDTFSVSFFHLDQTLYQSIGHETFNQVIDHMRAAR